MKDAAATGSTALLEPLAAVDITVPDAHVGSVLSDLSGRRGRVTGTEPDPSAMVGMERTVVHAEVPDAELVRYATTLRSITAGTGRFTRRFARYELVPPTDRCAHRRCDARGLVPDAAAGTGSRQPTSWAG